MNNKAGLVARACRGPILLITIGVLFAAQQAGVASFERTWPLLIIVLGLMKLVERMVAPQSSVQAGPYSQPWGPNAGWQPPQAPPAPPPSQGVRR